MLKNITKKVLPKSWLNRYEPLLRRLYAFRFRGRHYYCNVCQTGLSKFITLPTGDLLCPFCGSLPRNRRLWKLLQEEGWLQGRILDFSPSKCLRRMLEKQSDIDYVSTDFAGEFEAQKKYDITDIIERDSSFDLIICFHVLEHVEADIQAISELYRILKKGGKVLVQTPFKAGDIFEDATIRTPEDRLKNFGQEDHVRIYSVQGLKKRLEQAGFDVQTLTYNMADNKNGHDMGLKMEETILVATK